MGIEDFNLKQDLGKGSFGRVIKVIRKSDESVYAMKQIKIQRLKEKDKKNALNQIRFLASIQHPNVVSYRQAFYDEKSQTLCVVMNFANQGDLASKIKKHIIAKVRMKEEVIWKTAFQLLQGLNKLHESNIIHRDVKPANVFFTNGVAQIGDLNVAKHLKDPFTITQTGTPYYASPQVWNEQPYDYKSDLWSLGCVLYQMAMLKPPFRADSPEKLFKKILSREYEKISSYYSKQLATFIDKLLTLQQKKRPTIKELLLEQKKMTSQDNGEDYDNDKQLLETIVFPQNWSTLNENLPKPKYQEEERKVTFKTEKNIMEKRQSKKLIPIPIQYRIKSEKNLAPLDREKATLARKPKVLGKNGSQKLIF